MASTPPSPLIKHDLAHLAALARADAAVQKLESVQQARGIDKAVEMYVRQELPRGKGMRRASKPTTKVNKPHLVEVCVARELPTLAELPLTHPLWSVCPVAARTR